MGGNGELGAAPLREGSSAGINGRSQFSASISTRVPGAHELVAHENYVVYFDHDDSTCSITVLAAVHVARRVP